MPRQLFDAVEVDIPCPNCGHEAKHTVGWLRIHKNVHCSYCGRRSDIDMGDIIQALEALDHAWDNLLDHLHSSAGNSSTTLENSRTHTRP